MNSTSVKKDQIFFSKAQVAYLESIYPERIMRADTSEAEVRQYFGAREVIMFIKSRIRD
jgi:hypothetical protein